MGLLVDDANDQGRYTEGRGRKDSPPDFPPDLLDSRYSLADHSVAVIVDTVKHGADGLLIHRRGLRGLDAKGVVTMVVPLEVPSQAASNLKMMMEDSSKQQITIL